MVLMNVLESLLLAWFCTWNKSCLLVFEMMMMQYKQEGMTCLFSLINTIHSL